MTSLLPCYSPDTQASTNELMCVFICIEGAGYTAHAEIDYVLNEETSSRVYTMLAG